MEILNNKKDKKPIIHLRIQKKVIYIIYKIY